jgi:hypothetical protein
MGREARDRRDVHHLRCAIADERGSEHRPPRLASFCCEQQSGPSAIRTRRSSPCRECVPVEDIVSQASSLARSLSLSLSLSCARVWCACTVWPAGREATYHFGQVPDVLQHSVIGVLHHQTPESKTTSTGEHRRRVSGPPLLEVQVQLTAPTFKIESNGGDMDEGVPVVGQA